MRRSNFEGYSDIERKQAFEKLANRFRCNAICIKYKESGNRVEFISGDIRLVRNRNFDEVLDKKKNLVDITDLVATVLNVPYNSKRGADITAYYVNDNLHLMGLGTIKILNSIALNEINAILFHEDYVYPLNGRGLLINC